MVRMNSPETRNALSEPEQIPGVRFDLLCWLASRSECFRAVVLTGNGKAFCCRVANIKDSKNREGYFCWFAL